MRAFFLALLTVVGLAVCSLVSAHSFVPAPERVCLRLLTRIRRMHLGSLSLPAPTLRIIDRCPTVFRPSLPAVPSPSLPSSIGSLPPVPAGTTQTFSIPVPHGEGSVTISISPDGNSRSVNMQSYSHTEYHYP